MAVGVAGLGGLGRITDRLTKARLTELESRLQTLEGRGSVAREAASEKVRGGGLLTRLEAAAFLAVSTKKLQRMEAAGTLTRCPRLGTLVRYASRDVLRLASANGKER